MCVMGRMELLRGFSSRSGGELERREAQGGCFAWWTSYAEAGEGGIT